MNAISSFTPAPSVFRPDGIVTLADVRRCAEAALEGAERRDTLCAFNVLADRLGLDLEAEAASAAAVRRLFAQNGPRELRVTDRRYANLRSLVVRAVQRFGMRRLNLDHHAPLSAAWEALLASASDCQFDYGVTRLARYCSAVGVAPEEVCLETLLGLFAALEAESMTKDPRKLVRDIGADWNRLSRRVPGWPKIILPSPWKTEPHTWPLAYFPESFQADVAAWVERMSVPNPLDPDAPLRALRPATIGAYVMLFRTFASVLIRRGLATREEVDGLAAFFTGDRYKEGLRHFLRPVEAGRDPDTAYAFGMAHKLMTVARTYVRVDAATQAEIERVCRRLNPRQPVVMGARNRDRLEQFDDPKNVARLLAFPEAEAARAGRIAHPVRRARGVERALAVALLICAAPRIRNLRTIRLDANLRRVGDRVHLLFEAAEVKNRVDLAFELDDETAALLERFRREHRPHLPGAEGPYLFPGASGGPRSDEAMRTAIAKALKKHCGLVMSPHLFRHATAKIIVERDPSMYAAVSRHLGHRRISSTLASYLGTETRAASRRLNQLLREARDNPQLGED